MESDLTEATSSAIKQNGFIMDIIKKTFSPEVTRANGDMALWAKHLTNMSFKAHKYGGKLMEAMNYAMSRNNTKVDIVARLQAKVQSYSKLSKADRKAVNDVLIHFDKNNIDYEKEKGFSDPMFVALSDKQREAFVGIREMFDDVKEKMILDIEKEIASLEAIMQNGVTYKKVTQAYRDAKKELAVAKKDLSMRLADNYWSLEQDKKKTDKLEAKVVSAEKKLETARENMKRFKGVDSEIQDRKNHIEALKKENSYFPRIRDKGLHLIYFEDGEWHRTVYENNQSNKGEIAMNRKIAELEAKGIVDNSQIVAEQEQLAKDLLSGKIDKKEHDAMLKELKKTSYLVDSVSDRPEQLFRAGGSDAQLTLMNNAMIEGGISGKALDVANDTIRTMFYSRGWRKHLLSRKGETYVGYQTEDLEHVLNSFIGGFAGITAKAEAAREYYRIIQDVDIKKQPNTYAQLVDFIQEEMRNADITDRISGFTNGIVYHMYMGFRASTALINSTQNFMLGVPSLGDHLRKSDNEDLQKVGRSAGFELKAAKDFASAMGSAGLYLRAKAKQAKTGVFKKPSSLTQAEVDFLDLEYNRIAKQNLTREMTEQLLNDKTALGKGVAKMSELSGAMFGMTENMNRISALLVYKRYFGANLNTKAEIESIMRPAELFVQAVHFSYDKWNQPDMFKNPTMRLLKPFMFALASYNQNLIQGLMLMDGRAKIGFAVAMLLMAGIPLEDIWEKWLMKFGNTHSRALLGNNAMADFATMGLPGVAGIDISGSLSLNAPPMLSMAFDVIGLENMNQGPFQQITTSVVAFLDDISSGKIGFNTFKNHFPHLATKSVLQAYSDWDSGLQTRSGKQMTMDGENIERTATSAFLKSLGIRTSDVGSLKTRMYRDRQLSDVLATEKDALLDRYIKARKSGKNIAEIKAEVKAFNRKVLEMRKKFKRALTVSPITGVSIKARLRSYRVENYDN